jgi:hypothetical protein
MNTKPSALKRAANAFKKAIGPKRYGVQAKPFVCQFCGHDRFKTLGGNVSILALYSLACSECGHVELFAAKPPVINDHDA